MWQDSISKNSHNTRSMMYLGLSYWKKGDRDRALEKLEQARNMAPENNKAALYSAHIYAEREEWESQNRFTGDWSKRLQIGPNTTLTWQFFGKPKPDQGEPGFIEPGFATRSDFALAHFNRGVFLDKFGDPDGALRAYQKAVTLQPESAHYQYVLGMFYMKRTDRPELGRNPLKLSLRLNPDQPTAETIRQTLLKSSC